MITIKWKNGAWYVYENGYYCAHFYISTNLNRYLNDMGWIKKAKYELQ